MNDCKCKDWAHTDFTHMLLTGHHANCPFSPKAIDKALELIADMAKGRNSK